MKKLTIFVTLITILPIIGCGESQTRKKFTPKIDRNLNPAASATTQPVAQGKASQSTGQAADVKTADFKKISFEEIEQMTNKDMSKYIINAGTYKLNSATVVYSKENENQEQQSTVSFKSNTETGDIVNKVFAVNDEVVTKANFDAFEIDLLLHSQLTADDKGQLNLKTAKTSLQMNTNVKLTESKLVADVIFTKNSETGIDLGKFFQEADSFNAGDFIGSLDDNNNLSVNTRKINGHSFDMTLLKSGTNGTSGKIILHYQSDKKKQQNGKSKIRSSSAKRNQ